MKNFKMIAITAFSLVGLTGCFNGPKPSVEGSKPTIYVKSKTAQKFKDVTEETAMWNGISPRYVKDKNYLRCDMTDEAMAVFATEEGFELATNEKNADYTFEVTVLSCGQHKIYKENRAEIPMKEKALFQDFVKLTASLEDKAEKDTALKVQKLLLNDDPLGYELFIKEKYIEKMGNGLFSGYYQWDAYEGNTIAYLNSTKGVVLPYKYFGIYKEDKKALENFYNKKYTDKEMTATALSTAFINAGSANTTVGGQIGGTMMATGVVLSMFKVRPPHPINGFKLINNRNGKSIEMEMRFTIAPQKWDSNVRKPMDDWLIDEIDWGEVN